MINHLKIKNYKSIKDLEIQCRKLNIFIGEPNTGKTNILESIFLFKLIKQNSKLLNLQKKFQNLFRYLFLSDLFYDKNTFAPIEISLDDAFVKFSYQKNIVETQYQKADIGNINYYEYKKNTDFASSQKTLVLLPPYGENLTFIIRNNKSVAEFIKNLISNKNLLLNIDTYKNEIKITKNVNGILYSYDIKQISETLQRIIFYHTAIETNTNNIILFDEPETNTFPLYTKYLAERIALDETNQFFITTHNPYLLINLIEKSKKDNLNLFITKMENYQTEIKLLNDEQINEVLDLGADVFLNFDKILAL